MMLLGPEWEIYALNPEGEILAYSAPPGKVVRKHISLVPVRQFFEGASFPLLGDDPRNHDGEKIFSVARITAPDGQLKGYLYVIIGGEKRDTLISLLAGSQVMKHSAWVLGSSLMFALVLLCLLFMRLTRPLKQLNRQVQDVARNGFHQTQSKLAKPAGVKEVDELDQVFERAFTHIQQQWQQIKTTEELRRELLSHVSHDLRTPLASLQGYLETWLLQDENQRQPELVDIALRNAKQLNLLVDQLFELAQLEGGEIKLNCEAIALAELASDVVQRLSLKARHQGVELSVNVLDGAQVNGDIAKLERVLVNLVDNAIRHTPSGGRVELEVKAEADSVAVAVKDNGTGIADTEVERIFEPRFRASNSQGPGGHAGLGLAIVKHVDTELHSLMSGF